MDDSEFLTNDISMMRQANCLQTTVRLKVYVRRSSADVGHWSLIRFSLRLQFTLHLQHVAVSSAVVVVAIFLLTTVTSTPIQTCNTSDTSKLTSDSTRFALSLYRQMSTDIVGNIVLSPLGIFCALGMTYLGARGDTQRQMKTTMYLGNINYGPRLNAAFRCLCAQLKRNDDAYQVHVANRLYAEQSFDVLDQFLYQMHTSFDASVVPVDFM